MPFEQIKQVFVVGLCLAGGYHQRVLLSSLNSQQPPMSYSLFVSRKDKDRRVIVAFRRLMKQERCMLKIS